MEVTEQEINHLARLSNFSLSPEEKTALKTDLGNIFKYISKLDELDTEGVEPTYQVFEMETFGAPTKSPLRMPTAKLCSPSPKKRKTIKLKSRRYYNYEASR